MSLLAAHRHAPPGRQRHDVVFRRRRHDAAHGSGAVSLKATDCGPAPCVICLQFPPSGVQIIMMEKHTSFRFLLEELRNAPHGAIDGHPKYKVMHLLANCWHELEGAGESAMQARKLDRAEDVSWNPPVLSFTIERHGATVLGSSRADLHRWSINMHEGTARCERGRYRQLLPTAPRLDVKAIAARVCEAVQQGPSSGCDLVKLGILVWKSDHEIEVKHGRLVPGGGYQQTVADRRRRFRKQLTERMQTIGWGLLSVQRSMTFRKV